MGEVANEWIDLAQREGGRRVALEDATDAGLTVVAVDRLAQRADVGAGARGAREQRQRGGRGARRPILGTDRVPPGRLAGVLPQELAGRGMEEADVHAVP